MIKAGLAGVYRGKPTQDFDISQYPQAEKEAQEAKSGICSFWKENRLSKNGTLTNEGKLKNRVIKY